MANDLVVCSLGKCLFSPQFVDIFISPSEFAANRCGCHAQHVSAKSPCCPALLPRPLSLYGRYDLCPGGGTTLTLIYASEMFIQIDEEQQASLQQAVEKVFLLP